MPSSKGVTEASSKQHPKRRSKTRKLTSFHGEVGGDGGGGSSLSSRNLPLTPSSPGGLSQKSGMSRNDSFKLGAGIGGKEELDSIGNWIYGEQSIGGGMNGDDEDAPLPMDEVSTSMCL